MSRQRGKVTERGQVTIPRRVRERLGIRPGDYLEFEDGGGGRLLARKAVDRDPIDELFGAIGGGQPTDKVIEELRGPADAVDHRG